MWISRTASPVLLTQHTNVVSPTYCNVGSLKHVTLAFGQSLPPNAVGQGSGAK